jgi:hypothetical protein
MSLYGWIFAALSLLFVAYRAVAAVGAKRSVSRRRWRREIGRPHHAGVPPSLKETLVRRAEARARADLLRQTQEHVHRFHYDCEAAERAIKYVKAGLDVWGFARWQLKYFPIGSYKGATLPQCKDIRSDEL